MKEMTTDFLAGTKGVEDKGLILSFFLISLLAHRAAHWSHT